MGLRLENRAAIDWDRTPAKRSERLNLDVKTSRGICMRAILRLMVEVKLDFEGDEASDEKVVDDAVKSY